MRNKTADEILGQMIGNNKRFWVRSQKSSTDY